MRIDSVLLVLAVVAARSRNILITIVSSLSAALCLDHLFARSLYSLLGSDSQNWVSLVALQVGILVVAGLLAVAHRRIRLTQRARDENKLLYEASRQMLVLQRQRPAGPQMIQVVERVFRPEIMVLFDADLLRIDRSQNANGSTEAKTRAVYLQDRDLYDEESRIWYRVLRLGSKPTGAFALKGDQITSIVADSLASLLAIGLERAQSLENESQAGAERYPEQLQVSILDGVAHEFKTPLTVIRTATAGLLESATLSAEQRRLATIVEEESIRASDLASQLLATARLRAKELVSLHTH